jgi:hypothetical protein
VRDLPGNTTKHTQNSNRSVSTNRRHQKKNLNTRVPRPHSPSHSYAYTTYPHHTQTPTTQQTPTTLSPPQPFISRQALHTLSSQLPLIHITTATQALHALSSPPPLFILLPILYHGHCYGYGCGCAYATPWTLLCLCYTMDTHIYKYKYYYYIYNIVVVLYIYLYK